MILDLALAKKPVLTVLEIAVEATPTMRKLPVEVMEEAETLITIPMEVETLTPLVTAATGMETTPKKPLMNPGTQRWLVVQATALQKKLPHTITPHPPMEEMMNLPQVTDEEV